jgi:hypothetical protein
MPEEDVEERDVKERKESYAWMWLENWWLGQLRGVSLGHFSLNLSRSPGPHA